MWCVLLEFNLQPVCSRFNTEHTTTTNHLPPDRTLSLGRAHLRYTRTWSATWLDATQTRTHLNSALEAERINTHSHACCCGMLLRDVCHTPQNAAVCVCVLLSCMCASLAQLSPLGMTRQVVVLGFGGDGGGGTTTANGFQLFFRGGRWNQRRTKRLLMNFTYKKWILIDKWRPLKTFFECNIFLLI